MILTPPEWGREMMPIPESTPIYDFLMQRDNRHLYNWVEDSKTLICGLSGNSYTLHVIHTRVEALARSLSHELGWAPNSGSPEDKVVGIFSFNTLDYLVASWAIHRVGGTCLLLHPTSSAAEIKRHISITQCRVLFTCRSLLTTSNQVLAERGVLDHKVFLLELPDELGKMPSLPDQAQKTVEQLVQQGSSLPPIEPLRWKLGQGREQVAYLCPTSGTSGLQKLAQITHYNIIANVIQSATFESRQKNGSTEIALGFLPLSHSYGLILAHLTVWRGDTYILQASFDMQAALGAIQQYKIERLYLVPPIISAMVNNPFLFELFDLSSVKSVVTGSGPFGARLAEALRKIRPSWQVLPGYGLTETAVIISVAHPDYMYVGTDGCLLPGVEARLIDSEDHEVDAYDQPGELYLRSPSNMKGYLGQEEATKEVFDEQGWLRTGDIAVFRIQEKDGKKTTYLDIVDRKKDIMKVKGMQVAPVEIESHLAAHPAVAEVAVVGVRDEDAGERPYAFIVRSPTVMTDTDEETLKAELNQLIEGALSEPHWLRKNITFVDEFPKSSNGKPLKYKLRQGLVAN
ncbi:NRPS-like protein biosynthetic cluster [Penicillium chermesinum]|uniref:NRPS-like protein biosynthetic cluster n=1 Tax=Penicillium chermesinum TaxID=63820 RepID=A0A9W9NHR1_9EURO|nr:NRPS-like protein biosynthetic cluster [Penicillium chermesinum]KAJ5220197.1 NRPS-like protein biosynthetic cluster [Penicillium chermesinum]KAJ6157641.1 NRPS-like protein biosynthetic cluster [Penicillium chermesinum]